MNAALSSELLARALGIHPPTDAQRAVIESPLEPALVVAGAGSGKTETMAARVVWLVANGLVAPDQVLGLTFTRKAAGELAERIGARLARVAEYAERGLLTHLEAIVNDDRLVAVLTVSGPDSDRLRRGVLDQLAVERGGITGESIAAIGVLDRPRVATYNSFADGIVRENAARIGRDPEAALLSASASWLIARDVVYAADDLGLEDGDIATSTLIDAVQALAAEMVDHRADPGRVAEFATGTLATLTPFVNPDLKTPTDIERAARSLATLPALVALVSEYEAEKARRGVWDFADQVTGALEIIEKDPFVADDLRERYRVVLLDEYQDTSVVQTQLLAGVFQGGAVMAVGDPHQSIYGWRGASADNLHAFSRAFAPGGGAARYDLIISWRNDRRILDAANSVLAPLHTDAGLTVPELAARPGAGEGRVTCRLLDTIDDEAEAVADWFVKHHDTDRTGAVLFRAKRHMPLFAAALERRGIPARILGLGGLLSTPEVTDLVSLLRVLHDAGQGSALIRLLTGGRCEVGVADLGALQRLASRLAHRASDDNLADEVRTRLRRSGGADEQASLVDALDLMRSLPDGHRLLAEFSSPGRERLREAAEMIDRLRAASHQPLPELLRLAELELRLDLELSAHEARGPARVAMANLRKFGDAVRDFLSADDRGTLGSLLQWLDQAERRDEVAAHTEPPEPGVVHLLTVHGSKGLEWDAVAVVRMVTDEFPKKPRTTLGWLGVGVLPAPFRGDRDALPVFDWQPSADSVRKDLDRTIAGFKREVGAHLLDEERRLAYVAITRARTDLLLTGSAWSGGATARSAGRYLTEVADALTEPIDTAEISQQNPYQAQSERLGWPMDPLGARRARVQAAASEVWAARAAGVPAPTAQIARLLAERDERRNPRLPDIGARVPASRFKDFLADFAGTVVGLDRPMPERPYRQTRIGTLFHQWVEERSGVTPVRSGEDASALFELDEDGVPERDPDGVVAAPGDAADLLRLQDAFLHSEWASLRPLAVEQEIDFLLPAVGGSAPRIVICKLDAVYRRSDRGGRIEIVDWKTGRAPRTAEETRDRMVQVALYRLAYSAHTGLPVSEIDGALFYVADDLVLRDDGDIDVQELAERWARAEESAR